MEIANKKRESVKLIAWFGLAIIILLSFSSCDIIKKSQKTKESTVATEEIETKTTRKGDTVTFIVPELKYRTTWRDTTIYTYSRQGTILKTSFDKSGQVTQIDCNSAPIEEMRKEIRSLEQQVKNKSKDKVEKVNTTFIIYGLIILGVVLIVGLWLMYRLIDKKTALLNVLK